MSGSVFAAAAGFLRSVSNQAAVSVAASAMAAAFVALPAILAMPSAGGQVDIATASSEVWTSPVASDGKIRERHQDAVLGDVSRGADVPALLSPAAIVMPMALEWRQAAVEVAALVQARPAASAPHLRTNPVEAQAQVQPVQLQAQVLPPRRPAAERIVVAADTTPLQVAPAAAQPAARESVDVTELQQRGVLGVSVPGPVSRAVVGAVGLVGAAGTWTLARASDLLPRL